MCFGRQELQEKRKDTEKHLRDTMKWLMSDSESWLSSLIERLSHLDRVSLLRHPGSWRYFFTRYGKLLWPLITQVGEKYLAMMDDLEQCQKEAGNFMDQSDEEILVSERPKRISEVISLRAASHEHGKSYLLDRFINDSRVSTPVRQGEIRSNLKSMQHFFLKVR